MKNDHFVTIGRSKIGTSWYLRYGDQLILTKLNPRKISIALVGIPLKLLKMLTGLMRMMLMSEILRILLSEGTFCKKKKTQ